MHILHINTERLSIMNGYGKNRQANSKQEGNLSKKLQQNNDDDVDERRKNSGFKSKAYIEWNSQTEQIKTIKRAEWWVHSTFVRHRQPSPNHSRIHTAYASKAVQANERKIIPHCHIAACGNVLSRNVWGSAMR